eukprot:COSAG06_NODE_27777_length_586_cov_8.887064_2_plen_52_part_01
MFVPSLSWQMINCLYKMAQQQAFSYLRDALRDIDVVAVSLVEPHAVNFHAAA